MILLFELSCWCFLLLFISLPLTLWSFSFVRNNSLFSCVQWLVNYHFFFFCIFCNSFSLVYLFSLSRINIVSSWLFFCVDKNKKLIKCAIKLIQFRQWVSVCNMKFVGFFISLSLFHYFFFCCNKKINIMATAGCSPSYACERPHGMQCRKAIGKKLHSLIRCRREIKREENPQTQTRKIKKK